ncbi:MAG: class II glutamine amidotransferase [Betaproteobacteria bacterium]|nr:class II glutamine amidotransferase [Betaproteobacteria bacterium]
MLRPAAWPSRFVRRKQADLRKLGPANFLYTDGETLFAHGHRRIQAATGEIKPPGLFLLSCRCVHADETVDAHGVSIGPGFQEVQLIASIPLTDENWRPFAEGEIVAVSAGKLLASVMP